MRFLNKRASWEDFFMYLLFTLGLVVFFYFAVFAKINAAINDTSYYKVFYARDLALLVDSLHAANGDFSVQYDFMPREGMSLDVTLMPDKVLLTDRSDKPVDERPQTSYVFGRSNYVNIIPATINRNLITFSVVANNKNITLHFPEQDVKLSSPVT